MRVLLLTPYISIPGDKRFTRKITDFGLNVFELAKNIVTKGGEVSFLMNQFTPGGMVDGVEIIGCSTQAAARHSNEQLTQGILQMIMNSQMKKHRIFNVYLSLLCEGYIEKSIHHLRPDVIHVHSLSLTGFALLAAALSSGLPTVISIHSLTDYVDSSSFEARFEQGAIETLNELGFTVSVDSDGMHSYILRKSRIMHPDKLLVIPPGIHYVPMGNPSLKTALRNIHRLPQNRFIIADIGSPHAVKQRSALLEGFLQLDADLQRNAHLLIPAEGWERARLSTLIRLNRAQENISLYSPTGHSHLTDIYSLADLSVYYGDNFDSGIPIIRSWGVGLPVLASADQETVTSLYHPQCMELLFDTTPQAFAEGLNRAVTRPWDNRAIHNHARAFSWDKVILQYQQLYGRANSVMLKPEELLARIFMKMPPAKNAAKIV